MTGSRWRVVGYVAVVAAGAFLGRALADTSNRPQLQPAAAWTTTTRPAAAREMAVVARPAVRTTTTTAAAASVTVSLAPATVSVTSTSSTSSATTPATSPVPVGEGSPSPSGDDLESGCQLAVWLWTWRFDDPPDRLQHQIVGHVTNDVAVELAPATDELARRSRDREVSWAIASTCTPTAGGASVVVDQHLVTATVAETVTRHELAVTFDQTTITKVTVGS